MSSRALFVVFGAIPLALCGVLSPWNDDHAGRFDVTRPFLDQVTSDCTMSPNGTAVRPHFFACNSASAQAPLFLLHDSVVTNATGDEAFPVDLRQTVRLFFDITNSRNRRRFDNMEVEVALYKRYSGWLGCGWIFIPTFGLLNKADLCNDNPSCPIRPGRQVVELVMEPSPMLLRALRMVHNDSIPYQLQIRIKNRRRPSAELLCVNYQFQIKF